MNYVEQVRENEGYGRYVCKWIDCEECPIGSNSDECCFFGPRRYDYEGFIEVLKDNE